MDWAESYENSLDVYLETAVDEHAVSVVEIVVLVIEAAAVVFDSQDSAAQGMIVPIQVSVNSNHYFETFQRTIREPLEEECHRSMILSTYSVRSFSDLNVEFPVSFVLLPDDDDLLQL